MRYTTLVEFGLLSVVWGMSYIRMKAFQKMYYRFIAWMIPASWFWGLWVMLAMLIGGAQDGGSVGKNALYAILFWVIEGGMEMIAWFLAKGNVLFYKWNEKEWWNYNPEESPGNWPDQMFERDFGDEPTDDTEASDDDVEDVQTDFSMSGAFDF